MKNEEFEDAQGKVIVEEALKSNTHRFIDLWLPRDEKFNVVISQDGKTTKSELSTFEKDDTCIATMK